MMRTSGECSASEHIKKIKIKKKPDYFHLKTRIVLNFIDVRCDCGLFAITYATASNLLSKKVCF